jgi:hypothetical protein
LRSPPAPDQDAAMPTRLQHVVVDATDPAALARWWAEALGWTITLEEPDEVEVEPPGPDGLGVPLVFVPVADPKVGKNRVHLNLRSATADDQAAQVARPPASAPPRPTSGRAR